jgi:hypothetical protein
LRFPVGEIARTDDEEFTAPPPRPPVDVPPLELPPRRVKRVANALNPVGRRSRAEKSDKYNDEDGR